MIYVVVSLMIVFVFMFCWCCNKLIYHQYNLPEGVDDQILKEIAESKREEEIKHITKEEKYMMEILDDIEIPYEYKKILYNDDCFDIVDFYFPHKKKIINVTNNKRYRTHIEMLNIRDVLNKQEEKIIDEINDFLK